MERRAESMDQLMKEHTRTGRIGYLSRTAKWFTLLIGAFLIYMQNWVFGILLVVLACVFLFMVKDHTVLFVCSEGIIIPQSEDMGIFLSFEEIEEFDFSQTNQEELYFRTKDRTYTVTTFDRIGTARLLNKPLQGKSYKDHVAERLHTRKTGK